MKLNISHGWIKLLILGLVIFMTACSLTSNPSLAPTPNPTFTPTPTVRVPLVVTPSPKLESRCEDLSGTLEIQILVGPAEAVGLEPFAVGEIPFSVLTEGGTYRVQGGGPISYQEVLAEEWGTYTVSLEMDTTIDGQCGGDTGSEALHMTIESTGEQMLEVRADGFSGDYPWSGTSMVNLTFPLEDGNTQTGEGRAFVLHLDK
jgi:hypothetical protein